MHAIHLSNAAKFIMCIKSKSITHIYSMTHTSGVDRGFHMDSPYNETHTCILNPTCIIP